MNIFRAIFDAKQPTAQSAPRSEWSYYAAVIDEIAQSHSPDRLREGAYSSSGYVREAALRRCVAGGSGQLVPKSGAEQFSFLSSSGVTAAFDELLCEDESARRRLSQELERFRPVK